MCRFQMRSCMKNCAISRQQIVEKYLTISSRTETRKNELFDTYFFGFNSKNRRDHIIKNTMVFFYSFTYTALMMWSPLQDRAMQNVQSPSLKTSNEEFLTKITYLRDHWMESACWAEQTQELMWSASTLRSYIESDDFIGQIIKFFITEVATAVTNHNKL